MADASVSVRLSDVEPIASFIKSFVQADAMFREMTPAEAALLPGTAVRAWTMLQAAVDRLGIGGGPRDFSDAVHSNISGRH